MSLGSDVERIEAMQELDRAIAVREPNRTAALVEVQHADQTVSALQKPVREITVQIRAIPFLPVQYYSAVCFNGRTLDRGSLIIGNENLRFEGWYGTLDVPFEIIASFEIGRSNLPSRSGIPMLGIIWPGDAKPAESLLISLVEKGDDPDCQVVLADLKNGTSAKMALEKHITKYSDVKAQRSKLEVQKSFAQDTLNKAVQEANQAKARLKAIELEIAPFRKKREELKQQQRQVDAVRAQAVRDAQNAARSQPSSISQAASRNQSTSSTAHRSPNSRQGRK